MGRFLVGSVTSLHLSIQNSANQNQTQEIIFCQFMRIQMNP